MRPYSLSIKEGEASPPAFLTDSAISEKVEGTNSLPEAFCFPASRTLSAGPHCILPKNQNIF